jgi:S1-C subfamily serine protease
MLIKAKSVFVSFLVCVAISVLCGAAAIAQDLTPEEIIEINSKAVVKILVLLKDKNDEYQFGGVGSGFFISHDGYIVTNFHVASEAVDSDAILVAQYWSTPSKQLLFTLKVVKSNRTHDLSLLKVTGFWDSDTQEMADVPKDTEFPCVVMGSSSLVKLGAEVIIIGFPPYGNADADSMLTSTMKVTRGIISGFNPDLNFFETDAVVHGGNSGGPALSKGGVVIGITSAIYEKDQMIGLIRPACDLRVILSTAILNDIDKERAENDMGTWDCGEGTPEDAKSSINIPSGKNKGKDADGGSENSGKDKGGGENDSSRAFVYGKVVERNSNRGISDASIVVMLPKDADVFAKKLALPNDEEWKSILDNKLVSFAQSDTDGSFTLSDKLDPDTEYKFVLVKSGYDMNMYVITTAGEIDVGKLEMDQTEESSDDSDSGGSGPDLNVTLYATGTSDEITAGTIGAFTTGAMEKFRDSDFNEDVLAKLVDKGEVIFAEEQGDGHYTISGLESGESYVIMAVCDDYQPAVRDYTAGKSRYITIYLDKK